MTPQYFAASSVYTDQLVPGKGALLQTFSTWHPNTNLNTQIQIKNLTPTLERRCNFSRQDWELFFLLSPGETRSRLSYDHSRISRRERDSIMLLSCFETRSRLQKIISRGRARKNEADSRREFPGSRILADLCCSLTILAHQEEREGSQVLSTVPKHSGWWSCSINNFFCCKRSPVSNVFSRNACMITDLKNLRWNFAWLKVFIFCIHIYVYTLFRKHIIVSRINIVSFVALLNVVMT